MMHITSWAIPEHTWVKGMRGWGLQTAQSGTFGMSGARSHISAKLWSLQAQLLIAGPCNVCKVMSLWQLPALGPRVATGQLKVLSTEARQLANTVHQ